MDKQSLVDYEAMAKLCLTENERAWILEKAHLLEQSFSTLSTIDTKDVEPLVTILDMYGSLREDMAEKSISREEILSNAPERCDGFFQAPKTLE